MQIRTKNRTVILLVISGGEMEEDADEIEEDLHRDYCYIFITVSEECFHN